MVCKLYKFALVSLSVKLPVENLAAISRLAKTVTIYIVGGKRRHGGKLLAVAKDKKMMALSPQIHVCPLGWLKWLLFIWQSESVAETVRCINQKQVSAFNVLGKRPPTGWSIEQQVAHDLGWGHIKYTTTTSCNKSSRQRGIHSSSHQSIMWPVISFTNWDIMNKFVLSTNEDPSQLVNTLRHTYTQCHTYRQTDRQSGRYTLLFFLCWYQTML